jgi:hypothetical protein
MIVALNPIKFKNWRKNMSEAAITTRSTTHKVGWWILFGISVLAVLNHAALIFVIPGEEVLFIGWTALSLFSALVLYFPYRQGEKWAWYSTWIFVLSFAGLVPFDAEIGLYYLVAAGLMAFSQILTREAFFPKGQATY